eukprot:scaffold250941_cov17-Tisochrysis_lutea.AAC.1
MCSSRCAACVPMMAREASRAGEIRLPSLAGAPQTASSPARIADSRVWISLSPACSSPTRKPASADLFLRMWLRRESARTDESAARRSSLRRKKSLRAPYSSTWPVSVHAR